MKTYRVTYKRKISLYNFKTFGTDIYSATLAEAKAVAKHYYPKRDGYTITSVKLKKNI